MPQLRAGLVVLVVAHGNSLRGLVKHLEGIGDEEIADLNIPTGIPYRYVFDDELGVVSHGFLGDAAAAEAAAEAVRRQAG